MGLMSQGNETNSRKENFLKKLIVKKSQTQTKKHVIIQQALKHSEGKEKTLKTMYSVRSGHSNTLLKYEGR